MTGDPDEMNPKLPLKELLIRWILSQGVSTILLMAILFGVYRGMDYAMDVAIPEHLRQIQSGYEKIENNHTKEVEALRKTFETSLERLERRHADLDDLNKASSLIKGRTAIAAEPLK